MDRGGLKYEVNSQTPFTGYTIAKYSNGQIKEKIQYKHGKKHGPLVEYYDNGQLQSQGISKDGKMEGPWVSYNKDGTVDEEYTGTFRDDMKISD